MALFVSHRERRLWFWTLAIVVAIFSTLGLAGALAEQLSESGLTTVGFAAAMLLVGVTVVIQGLRTKPTGAEIGVALGVAVAYLMVLIQMALAERSHLIEYGVVASFIYEALKERAARGGRVPVPAVLTVLATGVVGVLDEGIQLLLPSCHFDPGRHAVQCAGRRHGSRGAGGAGLGETWESRHTDLETDSTLGYTLPAWVSVWIRYGRW